VRTDCGKLNYCYEAIEVEVLENGCYNLVGNSTIDTHGYIYKDHFNPMVPSINILAENWGGYHDDQFELEISLLINTKYILVVTTFDPKVTGVFSVNATGPNSVNFNRIKYL